jgi:ABC-type multidrug transport system fused ATPase/permease subunit
MSTNNISQLILNVNKNGVKPNAYVAFTNSLVNSFSNGAQAVTTAYDNLTVSATRILLLFVFFFIILLVVAILLFFYAGRYISLITFIVGIVVAIVVAGLFYYVLISYARDESSKVAEDVGANATAAGAYISSSIFRDALYLALLK